MRSKATGSGGHAGGTDGSPLVWTPLPRTAAGRTSTPYYLVTIGNAISWGSAREYLHRFGIGVNEWRVMAHIANDPGCTGAGISGFLRIDKSVVSRSLKRLVEKGLVGIDARDSMRRVYLTEHGVTLHDDILPIALRREEILLNGLDAAERAQLIEILRKVHANLTEMNEFDHPSGELDATDEGSAVGGVSVPGEVSAVDDTSAEGDARAADDVSPLDDASPSGAASAAGVIRD